MFIQFVANNPYHESTQNPFKYEDGLLTMPLVCICQKYRKHESFCPGEQVLINHGDDIAVLDQQKMFSIQFIGAAGGHC